MSYRKRLLIETALAAGLMFALAGCEEAISYDRFPGADTNQQQAGYVPPKPDDRGVITYQSYQVALAMRGDTVRAMAERFGQNVDQMARMNGIHPDTSLRAGEVIVLPNAVGGTAVVDGQIVEGPIRRPGEVDIETIAGDAIETADPARRSRGEVGSGTEPLRHRVRQGETAQSVARQYGISVSALADWNGLGSENSLRVGQILLIPPPNTVVKPVMRPPQAPPDAAPPGTATPVPQPPSASKPLPKNQPAATAPVAPPKPAPKPAAGSGTLTMPVKGSIIRDFQKGKSDGIDISAPSGSPVVAAGAGTVAAITQDSDGVPILVIRHADGLLTVYAGIDKITVKRGDAVKRGQQIAVVRAASKAFLHFETRRGFESVDPTGFLN